MSSRIAVFNDGPVVLACRKKPAGRAHSPEDGWTGREGGCPACPEDADEVFASVDFGHGAAAA